MSLRTLQSLLLISAKPLSLSGLQKTVGMTDDEFKQAIVVLQETFNTDSSGIHLIVHEGKAQFASHPDEADVVKTFFKQEMVGELSRPSLETLTIIAYRGPMTKPEIEQIRGVNCSMILRNLLMRGLINEKEDRQRLQPVYTVSVDFIRHLGLDSIEQLPDFAALRNAEIIEQVIEQGGRDETV